MTNIIYKTKRKKILKYSTQTIQVGFMKNLELIKKRLQDFAAEREWDQFHSPKNLSMALSVEASELLECFQWLTEEQSKSLNPKQLAAVTDEIADIQLYLIRLADKLDIDIGEAVDKKIIKNEKKYPADKVRGSSKKYTEYKSENPIIIKDAE